MMLCEAPQAQVCVFKHTLFTSAVLPVYLCIRNRDVVCGILNQQAVNSLLQVWPVVFPVVFYSHCIQNWVKRGEQVRFYCTGYLIRVKPSGLTDRLATVGAEIISLQISVTLQRAGLLTDYRTSGPAVTVPALSELTELGSRIEGEFSFDRGWRSRAVRLAHFAALAAWIRVHELWPSGAPRPHFTPSTRRFSSRHR